MTNFEEDMEDSTEDWFIPESQVEGLISDTLSDPEASSYMKEIGTDVFLEQFLDKKVQKRLGIKKVDGGFVVSIKTYHDFLNQVISDQINKDIAKLVEYGIFQMVVDEDGEIKFKFNENYQDTEFGDEDNSQDPS